MDITVFSVGIILGILMTFFCYRIYSLTRGGSRGWMLVSVAGISMALWSISNFVYEVMGLPVELQGTIGTLTFALICTLSPIGTFFLVKDMNLPLNRLLTTRNFLAYYCLLFAAILLYNMSMPYTNIFAEMYSVSQIMITISLPPMCLGFLSLWRGTRKKSWILFTLFTVLITSSQVLGMYATGCCGEGGQLAGTSACSEYTDIFVEVFPLECSPDIVPMLIGYRNIDLVAYIIAIAGFFLLWRPMEHRI